VSGLERRGRLPRALVRLSLERPRAVLVAWALLAVLATPGVLRLDVETSTDSVLDRHSGAWRFYQESLERFGGDEILTLLIEGEEPFDPETLREVERLTERFEQVPGVWRVDSLATVPLVSATPDGALSLAAALDAGLPVSEQARVAFAERVAADRIAPRTLVSRDGRAFAVNLVLERGAESRYVEILAVVEHELEGQRAWVSGVPIFRMAADARTRSELRTFVPLTLVAMAVLLFGLFGSVRAVWIPLVATGAATWLVMGVMGALEVPVTITTVVLPSVLLALGCAYAMHLLTAAAGCRDPDALREASYRVALPIALSGLTTAVGFVAVAFVRIDAVRDIGGFGALGVLVVLAATLTAAPASLRLWPLPERRERLRVWLGGPAAEALVGLVVRHRRALLFGWAITLAAVGVGIARVQVETDVIVWFPRSDPIRVDYDAIVDRLSGISPMNVIVEAPSGGVVSTPEVMAAIDGLAAHLEALPSVGRVLSIADPLRQLHAGFLGTAGEPLPNDAALLAQYLLLLDSKSYTRDLISPDRSAANVRMRVDDNGSDALLAVADEAHAWWARWGVEGVRARATGIMYEFGRAEDEIAWGQLRGLTFALLAVAGILLAIFRWPALAALALVPNAVPIAMAFGVMGLAGLPLDAGTVILGNLALGIAVDDTIHLAVGFHRRCALGSPPQKALLETLRAVLAPLVYTSLAVALGFAGLGISGFTPIRHLGLLTAGVMLLCLLADLLLLPALLLRLRPAGGRKPA